MTVGGRRIYTIQVAEKGIIWTRLRATRHPRPRHRCRTPDNAAIKLAEAVTRLAATPRPARVIPVVRRFFDGLGLPDVAAWPNAARPTLRAPRPGEAVADPVCAARSTRCCATRSPRT